MRPFPILLAAVVIAPAGRATAQAAAAPADSQPIHEWTVPYDASRPRDPYLDRQGRVWFVGQRTHYVAMLDPRTGEFKKYDLAPGAGPHNLIVDTAGFIWYSGNTAAHIGRLDPRDGSIRKFPMPDSTVRDPHTMIWDKNGDIWFTAQGGNAVGRLAVRTGEVRLIKLSTPRARPYGIWLDPSGRPWFVEFGTNKIGTVNPATFELTEYDLPRAETRPRRMAITSDGAIWYDDYATGRIGRLDPRTKQVEEWPLPGGPQSRPYAMTVDDQDRLWVVETGAQPNRFVGFDSRTKQFLAPMAVPGGAGTIRHMVFDPRARVIWFGTDNNTVGSARVPSASPTVP